MFLHSVMPRWQVIYAFRCLTILNINTSGKTLKTSIFTIFGRTTFANTIPLATDVVPKGRMLMFSIVTFCRTFGRWDGAGNSAGTWIYLLKINHDVDLSMILVFGLVSHWASDWGTLRGDQIKTEVELKLFQKLEWSCLNESIQKGGWSHWQQVEVSRDC